MLITAPATTPTALVGGRTEPTIAIGGGPEPASIAQGSNPSTTSPFLESGSGSECSSCCQREELMMSIERRDEQRRVDDQVLARMAETFAASRP